METLEQQFNSRVGAFLGTRAWPDGVRQEGVGDPNLMRQIDGGRSPSLRTADRVLAFMAGYGGDSCGARDAPRRHLCRQPSPRARRTRRSRTMREQPTEYGTNPTRGRGRPVYL